MKGKINTKALPGFLELAPKDQIAFNKMIDTIKESFECFGFVPLDTPAIERSETLLAKAGIDTEKQIYRFNKGENDLSLRFDLTVPLARYVAEHFNELTFPFKRYQIAKVWRGERSQKGRYREFYQCDIDIIGNETLSLINDAEIPSVITQIFKKMDFGPFVVRISNRKLITGLLENLGVSDMSFEIMRIIDKFDKVGRDGVQEMLSDIGLEENTINDIFSFMEIDGDNDKILEKLKDLEISNQIFIEGIRELESVVKSANLLGIKNENFVIDLTIARGLDYYTGTVYETSLTKYPEIGSVCSGGRYDNLAGKYTDRKLPGVGISIGLTRLFSSLKEADLIETEIGSLSKVLIVPLTKNLEIPFKIAAALRNSKIPTEIYLESGKLQKKLKYANKLKIPFSIIVGEDEVASGKILVRDMFSGDQKKVSIKKVTKFIKKKLKY